MCVAAILRIRHPAGSNRKAAPRKRHTEPGRRRGKLRRTNTALGGTMADIALAPASAATARPALWLSRRVRQAVKLSRLAPSPIYRHGLRHRVAAAVEHRQALAGLPLRTVIDIGANRGQFSLFAAATFPDATIIAFEPLAGPAAVFRRIFAANPGVTLHRLAIGPERDAAPMNVSCRDDSSSLLPIGDGQQTVFPGTGRAAVETVTVAPLADVVTAEQLAPLSLVKLDVQGFELAALRGCAPLLGAVDYVYAECSFVELYRGQALAHEIIEFCAGHGFRLNGVHNLTYHADRAIQGDFLFAR